MMTGNLYSSVDITESTTTYSPTTPVTQKNIIDATDRFKKGSTQTEVPGSERKTDEIFVEAKDFPIKLDIPVYANKGEKITIRLIREQIGTIASGTFDIPKESNSIKPFEKRESTSNSGFTESVDELHDTNRLVSDTITDKQNKAQEVSPMEEDYAFKMINYVQNTAIAISLVLTVFFVFTLAFDLLLPKTDSIFAFILSSMGAFLFLLDKQYRRAINK